MKYVMKMIESLLLICFIIVKLFQWDLILSLSGPDKDRYNWEDLGLYPNWKEFIHSKFNPNLSQPLSMHHLMKYSHHFETLVYEFRHPLRRMCRPYILDSDKYSIYNKTQICILLYVGIYIFPC
jgi:hypothetical protein